jgi:hypothetical protein
VVLATGQQPVFAAEASDFGQQPVLASPAQHGFAQSAGQAFDSSLAQHGLVHPAGHSLDALTAQHGLVESSGQVFAAEPHSAFSDEQAFAAGQLSLAFTCGLVSEPVDKRFE